MIRNKFFAFAAAALMLACAGCGKKTEEATAPAESPVASSSAVKTVDPATAGSVKGRVLFSGEAPARTSVSIQGNPECALHHEGGSIVSEELLVNAGALQNAFVYVKQGLEDYRFPVPAEPVLLDNRGCVYVPHVLGVQVDQPLTLMNSDATLHNVHSYAKNTKAFNVGLPIQGMKQNRKFSSPEVMIQMKCDVHPWMTGYVGVLTHPFFAVSGEDGTYELKGLPPGKYTVEAWHEKLGTRSQEIEIGPLETKQAEFTFGPQP